MKADILTIDGKKKGQINLPKAFSSPVREDVVFKILEAKKTEQPYGPSPVAGNQYSASGKIVHRRHVWKSQYGRGMSRIPRKRMSRRGTQFNWVGATVPNTRGGRRAHPPKILSRMGNLKVNKKELLVGLMSAISATAKDKYLKKKYATLEGIKIEKLPLIIESKITSVKTKDLIKTFKIVLGKELYEIAIRKKDIRKGKGKLRGRKYKKTAGLLIVIGNEEKLKTKNFDVKNVKNLGVVDLAKGQPGRLTIYTENAIKDLGERFK
jgi:large subunit ribosomal protein L4e